MNKHQAWFVELKWENKQKMEKVKIKNYQFMEGFRREFCDIESFLSAILSLLNVWMCGL